MKVNLVKKRKKKHLENQEQRASLNNKNKAIEYFNIITNKYPASDYYIKASELIISLK